MALKRINLNNTSLVILSVLSSANIVFFFCINCGTCICNNSISFLFILFFIIILLKLFLEKLLQWTYSDRSAASKETSVLQPYSVYAVTIAEVEIDLLTGQHIVRRVDLVEDCGVSLNPEIDLGQIEGAFVMGIGNWTSEELVYDPKTGALTNDRTWVNDLRRISIITIYIFKRCYNFSKMHTNPLKRIVRLN